MECGAYRIICRVQSRRNGFRVILRLCERRETSKIVASWYEDKGSGSSIFSPTKSEWVYTPTRVVKEPRVGESPRNTLKKRHASHESNQTNRHILPVDQKARNNNTLKISLLLFLERILFNVCWYCRLCKWKSGRGRDLKLLSYYYYSSRLHIDRAQTANRWHRRVPSSLRYR